MTHPYLASTVALIFIDHMFWLHRMPTSIVSDHDSQSYLHKTVLERIISSTRDKSPNERSYHPKSDGQTVVVNCNFRDIFGVLHKSLTKRMSQWLSWAERWYNMTIHLATNMSPLLSAEATYITHYVQATMNNSQSSA